MFPAAGPVSSGFWPRLRAPVAGFTYGSEHGPRHGRAYATVNKRTYEGFL